MKDDSIVTKTIKLNVDKSKVWNALTNPEIIKQYLFGTQIITDWKVDSEIIFQGNWEGKEYKDKGKIKKFETEKILQYLYWSSFSGLEDKEENYSLVTFEITPDDKITTLTVSQRGFANDTAREHSDNNWGMVLQQIKKLVET